MEVVEVFVSPVFQFVSFNTSTIVRSKMGPKSDLLHQARICLKHLLYIVSGCVTYESNIKDFRRTELRKLFSLILQLTRRGSSPNWILHECFYFSGRSLSGYHLFRLQSQDELQSETTQRPDWTTQSQLMYHRRNSTQLAACEMGGVLNGSEVKHRLNVSQSLAFPKHGKNIRINREAGVINFTCHT
jgi:hypothetical protein